MVGCFRYFANKNTDKQYKIRNFTQQDSGSCRSFEMYINLYVIPWLMHVIDTCRSRVSIQSGALWSPCQHFAWPSLPSYVLGFLVNTGWHSLSNYHPWVSLPTLCLAQFIQVSYHLITFCRKILPNYLILHKHLYKML